MAKSFAVTDQGTTLLRLLLLLLPLPGYLCKQPSVHLRQ